MNQEENLYKSYGQAVEYFEKNCHGNSDVNFREFLIPSINKKCFCVSIDGLADSGKIEKTIIKPLLQKIVPKDIPLENIPMQITTALKIEKETDLEKAMHNLFNGNCVLLIEGAEKFFVIEIKGWQSRGISTVEEEITVRGPKDCFTENFRTNTAQIRRRVKSKDLIFEDFTVGRHSRTTITIAYMAGLAPKELPETLKERILKIDIDNIADSGQIEQLIEKNSGSPFPQCGNTERPDKAAAAILEGRAVVIVDGSPAVLIFPTTLSQFMQTPDESYEKWQVSILLRGVRWVAFYLSLLLPALYIAVIAYHPGIMPTNFILISAANRQRFAFSAIMELFILEFFIELIREASIRMPKNIGQTFGVVGGIIVGDAAIRSGIVSPLLVVVIGITVLASFAIPSYNLSLSLRLMRFPVTIMSAMFGLFGFLVAFILITCHVVNMRSLYTDYAAPYSPLIPQDFTNIFASPPLKKLKNRPFAFYPRNKKRQK